jgi:hypothetical protein
MDTTGTPRHPLDLHWTAEGHRAVARKILDWMGKNS